MVRWLSFSFLDFGFSFPDFLSSQTNIENNRERAREVEVEVRRVQFENHTIILGLGYHNVLSYDFFCFINLGLFVCIHRS